MQHPEGRRGRHTHTHTDTPTDRQTSGPPTETHANTQTNKDTRAHTHTHASTHAHTYKTHTNAHNIVSSEVFCTQLPEVRATMTLSICACFPLTMISACTSSHHRAPQNLWHQCAVMHLATATAVALPLFGLQFFCVGTGAMSLSTLCVHFPVHLTWVCLS